jgi:hypothetical protein
MNKINQFKIIKSKIYISKTKLLKMLFKVNLTNNRNKTKIKNFLKKLFKII